MRVSNGCRLSPVMRRARGTTDAASGQASSAGMSLSPAGAPGVSLVVAGMPVVPGELLHASSEPGDREAWRAEIGVCRQGGLRRSLQNATSTSMVSPTETGGS